MYGLSLLICTFKLTLPKFVNKNFSNKFTVIYWNCGYIEIKNINTVSWR